MNVVKQYEATRPFTDSEAWFLFRLAAIGEAIGWTLLIVGILLERLVPSLNGGAVAIAGRVHGTLFVVYLAACLALYPSLGWSRWRALIALAMSTPPFGSLAFEQWEAHRRCNKGFKTYRQYALYLNLVKQS